MPCMELEGVNKSLLLNMLSHKDTYTQELAFGISLSLSVSVLCVFVRLYYVQCHLKVVFNVRFTTASEILFSQFSWREIQWSVKLSSFAYSFAQ